MVTKAQKYRLGIFVVVMSILMLLFIIMITGQTGFIFYCLSGDLGKWSAIGRGGKVSWDKHRQNR